MVAILLLGGCTSKCHLLPNYPSIKMLPKDGRVSPSENGYAAKEKKGDTAISKPIYYAINPF